MSFSKKLVEKDHNFLIKYFAAEILLPEKKDEKDEKI
jgi:hypothetical protein